MKLSFVVPCFNEEGNIVPFTERVREVFGKTAEYEIIFIDDGSRDGTALTAERVMGEKKEKIKLIRFSRNFGKEAAMYAGLKEAQGEYTAVIDADLQQDPVYVKKMLAVLESEGADCVCACQNKRKEGMLVSLLKKGFYFLSDKLSDIHYEKNGSDFRVFNRKFLSAVLSLTEYDRFSKGIFSFVGFDTRYITYEVGERNSGESKWSMGSLFRYAFSGIRDFSVKPLKIPGFLGFLCVLVSLVMLVAFALTGFTWDKLILTGMFFLSGIILLSLRIMCDYLALTYIQGKNRPVYIVSERKEN